MFEDANRGIEARNDVWLNTLQQESAKKPRAYDELMEIKNRQKIDSLNNQLNNDDMMVSMIGATDYGAGNFLDQAQIENVNKQRGTYGENGQPVPGQIRDAGYNKDGDYQIDVWQKQQDGAMGVSSRVVPKKQLYGIMSYYSGSGMFSPETIDGLRNSIQESDPSYTSSQFDALGAAYGQRRQMIEDQINRTMYGNSGAPSRVRGAMSLSGGTGKANDVGSGKFNSDQVQYYINKQQQLSEEKAGLDPRRADDAKRMAEIDEEILDAKAYERLAARQGLHVNGMSNVVRQSGRGPESNADTKVAEIMAGSKMSNEGGRTSPFGVSDKNENKDVKSVNTDNTNNESENDEYEDFKNGQIKYYTAMRANVPAEDEIRKRFIEKKEKTARIKKESEERYKQTAPKLESLGITKNGKLAVNPRDFRM